MQDYQLFLIDLDGTVYRGSDTIDSGVRFVKRLVAAGKDYLFLTNNTTRTPQMVAQKLAGYGVKTDVAHIYTPSMATVSYLLARHPQTEIGVYVIGEIGLKQEFLRHSEFHLDEQDPDYVIVGMDTDLTYHKIQVAASAIHHGATFIGTNADLNLPMQNGLMPGNGSVCQMIAAASGQEPIYIGKPAALIVDYALKKANCSRAQALLVGDNYETDVKAGFNSQVDQLLALTGITARADLAGRKAPTYVVDSLDEFKL